VVWLAWVGYGGGVRGRGVGRQRVGVGRRASGRLSQAEAGMGSGVAVFEGGGGLGWGHVGGFQWGRRGVSRGSGWRMVRPFWRFGGFGGQALARAGGGIRHALQRPIYEGGCGCGEG